MVVLAEAVLRAVITLSLIPQAQIDPKRDEDKVQMDAQIYMMSERIVEVNLPAGHGTHAVPTAEKVVP